MSATCSQCGAKTVEYPHSLGTHHVVALCLLKMAGGGPLNLKTLSLTRNQWDNFQKLRYWGLASSPKRGLWEITTLGRRWLAGTTLVNKRVWTYRGNTVSFDGPLVGTQDVAPGYALAEHYARGAR